MTIGPASLPPWAFMWMLVVVIYTGFKAWTFLHAKAAGTVFPARGALGYLFMWPGMDPLPFAEGAPRAVAPRSSEWAAAIGKTLFGAGLLWGAARAAVGVHSLLAGWTGMVGLIFILHFGTFHILALAWRSAGVGAVPIMKAPILSESLSEFWGKRWNLAFRDLSYTLLFRPFRRKLGAGRASFLIFLLSGLTHDLAISWPAGGGYGLPTAFFVAQSVGIACERSAAGRHIGLGGGMTGRVFAWAALVVPAFWLFHPPFVRNVMLPFMEVLGAL